VLELGSRLIDRLDEIGATVVTPREPERRGPLVCVRSTDVIRLCSELAEEERIVTSHRDDALRIALHLYNVAEDVDRVIAALAARRHLLA
jgi:selenocysteine lyase/cysteine desulfurase